MLVSRSQSSRSSTSLRQTLAGSDAWILNPALELRPARVSTMMGRDPAPALFPTTWLPHSCFRDGLWVRSSRFHLTCWVRLSRFSDGRSGQEAYIE